MNNRLVGKRAGATASEQDRRANRSGAGNRKTDGQRSLTDHRRGPAVDDVVVLTLVLVAFVNVVAVVVAFVVIIVAMRGLGIVRLPGDVLRR